MAPVEDKIDVQEKVLVVMFNNDEQQSLQKHTSNVFTESSLTFTHKDAILLNPQDFKLIIIDLFGIADEDVEANLDLYEHYAKGTHPVAWLVQEDENDVLTWAKVLNANSHFIEVGDETEIEVEEIKQAITYGQNLNKQAAAAKPALEIDVEAAEATAVQKPDEPVQEEPKQEEAKESAPV